MGLLLSSMLINSCTNDMEDIVNSIDYKNYPSQSAENIEIIRTDSGRIVVKIFAPVMEHYESEENPYDEFTQGIEVITYANYPDISSSLVCDYAMHKVEEGLWEARDNVIGVNLDGDTIKTEQMFWSKKSELIYSEKYTTIRSGSEIIHGSGFTAKQDFSDAQITNGKGVIYLDE